MDPHLTAPPVVAVVVTSDAGPWLEEALASLGAQEYPNLSVLVIDAASADDPTPRVAAALPNAFIRRLPENRGYAAAANEAIGMVEGAVFFAFCHDDVALAPNAVTVLVDEALRSNAGIVGPKLVAWDDPERLLQVGLTVDKAGTPAPLVERGELDQEQHDSVRDVFVVPGGCTVVRADLFEVLGGFDRAMRVLGEDVDLCWRAQVAGARVLVVPDARVRHLEALPRRRGDHDRRLLQTRHRLRTVLKCYSVFTLLLVLPQVVMFLLAEFVYALAAGRRDQARDLVGAVRWNAEHLGDTWRVRRAVQHGRRVPDRAVRRLQIRGSARVTAFIRGQLGGEDRALALAAAGRDLAGSFRRGPRRTALLVWTAVLAVVVVGSRELVTGRLPAIGELAPFPDGPSGFLRPFLTGWRFSGLGSESPAPAAFGLLGAAGTVLLGAMGFLQKLLVLGALPAGTYGVWRLAKPFASYRARLVAVVVYASIPLPYNALARGRWGGLLAYALVPYLFGHLARATGLPPFKAAPTPTTRRLLAFGLLLAVSAALAPALAVLVLFVGVTVVVGSLLAGGVLPAWRGLGFTVAALALAAVLLVPWSLEFALPGADWSTLSGVDLATARGLSWGRVLRFQTGPLGAAPLGWVFLVAAGLPLAIGRDWRLAWAGRLWVTALASFALVWAGGRGWVPFGLPAPEVLLVPAAVALALAAATGMAAFETDLPGYRFGWRQVASVAAAGAALIGVLPVLGAATGGRWDMPGSDFHRSLAWMHEERSDGAFRVLWLGDPEVLPLTGWRLAEGLAYGLSDEGPPDATGLWPPSPAGATELVPDALSVARSGGTTNLGHLLGPMAVRYVVVAERAAPAREEALSRPVSDGLLRTLGAQVDLRRATADRALVVYENTAWAPGRAVLSAEAVAASRDGGLDAALDVELAGSPPVLPRRDGLVKFEGPVPAGSAVYLAQASSSRWRLEVGGRAVDRRTAFGWANAFEGSGADAPATLSYRTSPLRYGLVALEALLWLAAARHLVLTRRRRTAGPGGVLPPVEGDAAPLAPVLMADR